MARRNDDYSPEDLEKAHQELEKLAIQAQATINLMNAVGKKVLSTTDQMAMNALTSKVLNRSGNVTAGDASKLTKLFDSIESSMEAIQKDNKDVTIDTNAMLAEYAKHLKNDKISMSTKQELLKEVQTLVGTKALPGGAAADLKKMTPGELNRLNLPKTIVMLDTIVNQLRGDQTKGSLNDFNKKQNLMIGLFGEYRKVLDRQEKNGDLFRKAWQENAASFNMGNVRKGIFETITSGLGLGAIDQAFNISGKLDGMVEAGMKKTTTSLKGLFETGEKGVEDITKAATATEAVGVASTTSAIELASVNQAQGMETLNRSVNALLERTGDVVREQALVRGQVAAVADNTHNMENYQLSANKQLATIAGKTIEAERQPRGTDRKKAPGEQGHSLMDNMMMSGALGRLVSKVPGLGWLGRILGTGAAGTVAAEGAAAGAAGAGGILSKVGGFGKSMVAGSGKFAMGKIPVIGGLISAGIEMNNSGNAGKALGAGLGTAGGAALGTMVAGPLGTMVGGMLGGMIGKWLGNIDWIKLADKATAMMVKAVEYLVSPEFWTKVLVVSYKLIKAIAFDFIPGLIKIAWKLVTLPFKLAYAAVTGLGSTIIKGWKMLLWDVPKMLGGWLIDSIKGVGNIADKFIVQPLANMFTAVWDGAKDLVEETILAPIKNFFGRIGEGFDEMWKFLENLPVIGRFFKGMRSAATVVGQVGSAVGQAVVQGGRAAYTATKEAASAVGNMLGLGGSSAKYESSGKPGMVSSGVGDPGGVSYGTYQMNTKDGIAQDFVKKSAFSKDFEGLKAGTPEFGKKWKEVANGPRGAEFAKAQHDSIARTHYGPAAAYAKSLGFNMDDAGVADAVWSLSVQHGGYKKVLGIAKGLLGNATDAASQVKALYQARSQYTGGKFDSRYNAESKDALAKAGTALQPEGKGTQSQEAQLAAFRASQEKVPGQSQVAQNVSPASQPAPLPTSTTTATPAVAQNVSAEQPSSTPELMTRREVASNATPKVQVNVAPPQQASSGGEGSSMQKRYTIDDYGIAFANQLLFSV